jgi:hypothetical protein
MRTRILLGSLLVMAWAGVASATTNLGISVNIGNAPPPPVVVVREEPHVVLVPGSTVYVVDDRRFDYDYFRYGVYWYIYDDGWWYRARSYRGPYRAVEVRYVPRAIINVPARHWKHHPHGGPPGQMKKAYYRDGYHEGYRDGRKHGKGGRGHGHD